METNLGVRLFHRTRKGYELTASGLDLFETVVRVEEELIEAHRGIFGRDQEMAGRLRFTSTENFIEAYLGKFVWEFLRRHDEIEIHLLCTQNLLSLSRGEADLAIRFTETPPDALVGRRLTAVAYGIYAAAGIAGDRFTSANQSDWDWVGIHNEAFNRMVYGTFSPSTRPKHCVDGMAAMYSVVRAGLGVAILPCCKADRDPTLKRLSPKPLLDPKFDMWILYHRDSRRTHRIRQFADFIAKQIKSDIDLFEGRQPMPI
jgi:DNA-binding transcriptional LysR family regulator